MNLNCLAIYQTRRFFHWRGGTFLFLQAKLYPSTFPSIFREVGGGVCLNLFTDLSCSIRNLALYGLPIPTNPPALHTLPYPLHPRAVCTLHVQTPSRHVTSVENVPTNLSSSVTAKRVHLSLKNDKPPTSSINVFECELCYQSNIN